MSDSRHSRAATLSCLSFCRRSAIPLAKRPIQDISLATLALPRTSNKRSVCSRLAAELH